MASGRGRAAAAGYRGWQGLFFSSDRKIDQTRHSSSQCTRCNNGYGSNICLTALAPDLQTLARLINARLSADPRGITAPLKYSLRLFHTV